MEENIEADALANLGSALRIPPDTMIPTVKDPTKLPDTEIQDPRIEVSVIDDPTANDPNVQDPSEQPRSWMSPIKDYILNGMVPQEEKNERAFRTRISRFTIIQGMLYKKSMADSYLKCLEDHEAGEVLNDFHEGDCGKHTGGILPYWLADMEGNLPPRSWNAIHLKVYFI